MLSTPPTLAFFDLTKPTTVSTDPSNYGLGGVLLQEHGGVQRSVAYCSRTLTQTQRVYAQIEECLGAVWTCGKFERYLVELDGFRLETEHKPLIPLINTNDLHDTPLRCQRLLIRLMRLNPKCVFPPGKHLVVADALSRNTQENDTAQQMDAISILVDEVETHVTQPGQLGQSQTDD